jgi:hypothetical protein
VATGPVLVLSYGYSGAAQIQEALAAGADLACTAGTGIVPMCEAAAETWRRVEGRSTTRLSRLALASIRGMVTAQVTTILASAGRSRWCEFAAAPPGATDAFLQVFPQTAVICVHRDCLDVIRAGVSANPWGLQGPALVPYLMSYQGNSVAALAAYWAHSAEELLAFEETHPGIAHHLRFEDVTADPSKALSPLRAALGLGLPDACPSSPLDDYKAREAEHEETSPAETTVPLEMVPPPLRQRVSRLRATLGYPRRPELGGA